MAEKKKTHSKVKDQKWGSDERADNLLANLLGETEAESAAEQRRLSAERKRKEALEQEEQARSAARRQLEAQAHLEAERTRQADMEAQRAQMRAEIERRRRRENGEVEPPLAEPDLEAQRLDLEGRQVDRAHEREWTAAQGLIAEQQRAIRALTEEVAANNDDVEPRRWNLGWLVMAALILIVAAGATYAFMPTTNSPAGIGEAPQGAYPTMLVQLEPIDANMTEVGLDLVAQSPNLVPTVIEAAPEVAPKPKTTHHRTPKPTKEPALTVPDVFGRSPEIIK